MGQNVAGLEVRTTLGPTGTLIQHRRGKGPALCGGIWLQLFVHRRGVARVRGLVPFSLDVAKCPVEAERDI